MSQEATTLPTNSILINYPAIDEILFPQKFIKTNMRAYNLSELSNGHIPNAPTTIGAHPLAILRGKTESGSSNADIVESTLPLIGFEQMTTSPESITLGVHPSKRYIVTPEFIQKLTDIPQDERMFSESVLTALSDAIENNDETLLTTNSIMKNTGSKISIWTKDYESTRLLKKSVDSLVIEFYRAIQKYGVKPQDYNLEPSLYNWDFGETLFGCEFNLPFIMRNMNYIVDLDLQLVKEFDIGIFETGSTTILSPFGIPGEEFVIGNPDY